MTCPRGLTVIVNVIGVPSHGTPPLVKRGVTVIVAVTGDVVRFDAVNAAMSPLPLAASPIVASLLVHAYVVVPTVLLVVNPITGTVAPVQTTLFVTLLTCPFGLTVMVNVCGGPSHVFVAYAKCGVTVIVATTGVVPVLTALNDDMLPVPLAASPMLVRSLVHVYVVVPTVFVVVKRTAVVGEPLQITWSEGSSTCAVGLTVIVNVCGVPSHTGTPLSKVGVTVTVATIGAPVRLIALNEAILPLPLPNSPIVASLFVHV